jgi:hypothetical protein
MRVVHVLRKPLSEGTVAANTLKHGVGGLNIDASRIAGLNPSVAQREKAAQTGHMGGAKGQKAQSTEAVGELRDRSSLEAYTTPRPGESLGRWPGNLILQHLDGCRCEGVKQVKANASVRDCRGKPHSKYRFQGEGTVRTDIHVGFADEDGKEAVANWICVEGCPVGALDEQSGERPSGGSADTKPRCVGLYEDGLKQRMIVPYTDTGGASRFFKQVGGKTDE